MAKTTITVHTVDEYLDVKYPIVTDPKTGTIVKPMKRNQNVLCRRAFFDGMAMERDLAKNRVS